MSSQPESVPIVSRAWAIDVGRADVGTGSCIYLQYKLFLVMIFRQSLCDVW